MKKRIILGLIILFPLLTNAQAIEKGYHGFVEAGYSLFYFGSSSTEINWYEINTIHGYQVNPYFFVGAGVGFHFIPKAGDGVIWKRDASTEIPLFADFRWNILKKSVTPFVDLRLGHDLTNGSGMYKCIDLGCRFALKNNQAINVMLALSSHSLVFQRSTAVKRGVYYNEYEYKDDKDNQQEGLILKVGYEF